MEDEKQSFFKVFPSWASSRGVIIELRDSGVGTLSGAQDKPQHSHAHYGQFSRCNFNELGTNQ